MAIPRTTMGLVHDRSHAAKMWSYYVFNAALADGASNAVAITVGDEDLHLQFKVVSSGSALVRFHENPTITACATASPYNMNRYLGGSGAKSISSATFGASPDVAAACWNTMLWEGHVPGQSKQTGGGGMVRAESEWILNKGETYTISACNAQGATGGVGIYVEFYEY